MASVAAPIATRTWSPGTAAVLSFFIPGLGQLYKGKIALGLVFLVVTVAGYAFLILPGICIHLFVIYDAYNTPSKEEEARQRLATPTVALSPEQIAARKKANARTLRLLIAVIAGLAVLAALTLMFGPKPGSTLARFKGSASDPWTESLRTIIVESRRSCTNPGDPFHQGSNVEGVNFWNIHCAEGQRDRATSSV